ncbi:MAG: divergent polysaccharide deacetylase family protein [Pseudomonadota bacterium]
MRRLVRNQWRPDNGDQTRAIPVTNADTVEVVEIEKSSAGLSFVSLIRGLLWGLVVFGFGSIALSLATPLPDHLPGIGRVAVIGGPDSAADEDVNAGIEAPAPAQEWSDEQLQTSVSAPSAVEAESAGQDDTSEADPSALTEPAATPSTPESPQASSDDEGTQQTAGTTASATSAATPPPVTPSDSGETAVSGPEQGDANEATTEQTDDVVAALTPPEDEAAAEAEAAPEIVLPGPALDVNARAFDQSATTPLMSVVLMDASNGVVSAETLQVLTMPLTLAVSPEGTDARDLAEAARAAGHEVLVELPLAVRSGDEIGEGLTAESPASALSLASAKALGRLDMAVGATAPDGAAMLNASTAMAAITKPMAEHGFAWVEPRAGVGSAVQRLATTSDLVYAQGNRVVAAGASPDQIYQVLEGAAFQARRDGASIVFVAASQNALQALVRWGLERGGQEVWFAPISAVIRKQTGR